MKLFLSSLFTLGILFGLLLSIFAVVTYAVANFYGIYINPLFLIGFTLVINFIIWLFSPYLSDWIYQLLYKINWIRIDGLRQKNPQVAEFVESVCKSKNIKVPKIGVINDDNPQAFTYGSAAFNARMVITQGIFTYLKDDEIQSVVAHEVGHIVHRDFIVMTFASTIVQVLYEIFYISSRTARVARRAAPLFLGITVLSYILYLIGTYVLLFLNRLREYYADEFSAEITKNPNQLSKALIKVAYGITNKPVGTEKEQRFINSTRTLGIFDFKHADSMGLAYTNTIREKNWGPVEGALLFDSYNPWGWVSELSSTHPLTGKRIQKLCGYANDMGVKPLFDFNQLFKKYAVDKKKLYKNFFVDLFFLWLPWILPVVATTLTILNDLGFALIPVLLSGNYATTSIPSNLSGVILNAISVFITALGVGILIRTLYEYSRNMKFEQTTIAQMMGDIYTSRVRGKPIAFKGKIVGRGTPGYALSKDLFFDDDTGLTFLSYHSSIPVIGDLIFALTKVKKLVGTSCAVEGWFFRGMTHWIELDKIHLEGKVIKSHARGIGIVFSTVIIVLGVCMIIVFSPAFSFTDKVPISSILPHVNLPSAYMGIQQQPNPLVECNREVTLVNLAVNSTDIAYTNLGSYPVTQITITDQSGKIIGHAPDLQRDGIEKLVQGYGGHFKWSMGSTTAVHVRGLCNNEVPVSVDCSKGDICWGTIWVPQPRQFNDYLSELNKELPKDKTNTIHVTYVRDDLETYEFASQFRTYLNNQGWKVAFNAAPGDPWVGVQWGTESNGDLDIGVGFNH